MLYIAPKNTKSYVMPTKVFYGRGLLKKFNDIIGPIKPKKIILVAGEHFKSTADFRFLIQEISKQFNLICFNIPIKKSNFSTINYLSNFCRKNDFDTIIAVGGGTVLDVSKSATILARNEGKIEDFLKKNLPILNEGLKMITIPTTAGTGSEVTPWATIWGEDNKKYSLSSSKYMFPKIAIVDPSTTDDLPSKVTAESGIDALCQSIEAYWNKNHNPVSDKYALRSTKLIVSSLEKAVVYGNKKSRDQMMLGSLLGGLSFSNTQTTICHAISYPITIHWNINHGQATSITLPLFIKQIFPLLPKSRLKELLHILEANSPSDASLKIETLMSNIGLKTKLSELGIKKNEISLIAKESIGQSRLSNSPMIPQVSELEKFLVTIF